MAIVEPRLNLELKARDPEPGRSLAICASLGLEDRGFLDQLDTYFDVRRGRLKLREQEGRVPELIAYDRPDRAHSRESRYYLVEVAEAESLRAALTATVGVKVEVRKRRRLFCGDAEQVHLDEVEGLGSFLEFELLAGTGSSLDRERERLEDLRQAFQVADENLIAGSYSDLVLGAIEARDKPR